MPHTRLQLIANRQVINPLTNLSTFLLMIANQIPMINPLGTSGIHQQQTEFPNIINHRDPILLLVLSFGITNIYTILYLTYLRHHIRTTQNLINTWKETLVRDESENTYCNSHSGTRNCQRIIRASQNSPSIRTPHRQDDNLTTTPSEMKNHTPDEQTNENPQITDQDISMSDIIEPNEKRLPRNVVSNVRGISTLGR
jgi:hypothetical protein